MRPKIEIRSISKTFVTRGGPVPVLGDLSFEVADGEFVAVIGPSGCGKSTLLGVLAGFERPDRGEVLVDGEPVREPGRKGMFIFQQPSLFPWLDLERNLVFGLNGESAETRRSLVAHYIALVGLEGFERAFPNQLSGGMQQRAELARALMGEAGAPLPGGAVRRARRADPAPHAGRAAPDPVARAPHRAAGDPRRGGGAAPGRSRARALAAAGPHPARRRGDAPAPPRALEPGADRAQGVAPARARRGRARGGAFVIGARVLAAGALAISCLAAGPTAHAA